MTFSASANPIAYQGATPVFVDSEPSTWNMDPALLDEAIQDRLAKGKKPKAIIVVHLYGMPAKMDEILSVGDRAFQQKAFDRLRAEVARGIPAVLVSHQLERVAALCPRAVLLVRGAVRFDGPAPECIAAYVASTHHDASEGGATCPVHLSAITLVSGTSGLIRPRSTGLSSDLSHHTRLQTGSGLPPWRPPATESA